MVLNTKRGGEICSVIDEGVLNTESAADLRKWLLQNVRLRAVVRLPEETFKPNKINVRSSLLYMERLGIEDVDLDLDYKVTFCDLESLGYTGSGEPIRGFRFDRLLQEAADQILDQTHSDQRSGYNWAAYDVQVQSIVGDQTYRFDLKYWQPDIRARINALNIAGGRTIQNINTIATSRGISPPAELYVDEDEGYALVVKASSNISKFGELVLGGDFIEKNVYDDYLESSDEAKQNFNIVKSGDILLASTGDGTLGKCCVYRSSAPAVADGHVTIIRVDPRTIDPDYLCDYLRVGFGARQIERLFTGSTGLVELTPDHVDSIVVDVSKKLRQQKAESSKLRSKEKVYRDSVGAAENELANARRAFSA